MAAEAAPVEEMAVHTEAFQDVEVFPTQFTHILCPRLHRPQGYMISWTQSQLRRSSIPCSPFLPF